MTGVYPVNDPDAFALLSAHDLRPGIVHTNLQRDLCVCRIPEGSYVMRPSSSSGNVCSECGGITQQTGTCYTCRECGSTGGCG